MAAHYTLCDVCERELIGGVVCASATCQAIRGLRARTEDAEAKLAEAELAVEQQANAIQELADQLAALPVRVELRDMFAMSALEPLVCADAGSGPFYLHPPSLAKLAYEIADAMLEARKATP